MTRLLQDRLTLQAERRPEACAVVCDGKRITYGDLDQASNRLARALKASGCGRGDRVALLLPKSIQALVAMFAALKADCIYVPLDTSMPFEELRRRSRVNERAQAAATSADFSRRIREGLPGMHPGGANP